MWTKRAGLAAVAAVLLMTGAGCGGDGGGRPAKTLTVLAAASLTGVFNQLGAEFEQAHPGVKVVFSFGGSSTLAQQVIQGAPADVFASASPATMKQVVDAGDALGTPTVFTRNQLVIAVAPGNPKGVASPADLARPGLAVVLCAPAVPCGAAAGVALAAAGVKLTPVSLEQDVKAALNKVVLGEADAALVYRTDVRASRGKADAVEFPESAKAINDYPIVTLRASKDADLAGEFARFIESPAARPTFAAAGFQTP